MLCKHCEAPEQHPQAYFCYKCGASLKKSQLSLLFYLFIGLIGALSAWGTVELKALVPSLSIFYCVVFVSIGSYAVLSILIKKMKDIANIAVWSGLWFIVTSVVMVTLSNASNTIDTYITSFLIGSAHISILMIIHVIRILLFHFKLKKQHIHKTLDTAETIIDISTPKGLVKQLKKMVEEEETK